VSLPEEPGGIEMKSSEWNPPSSVDKSSELVPP